MLCYDATVESKRAAADTDRAAAHSPQQSSQLSEVQPLTIMSIHHRPFANISLVLREKLMTPRTSYVSHIELCLSERELYYRGE